MEKILRKIVNDLWQTTDDDNASSVIRILVFTAVATLLFGALRQSLFTHLIKTTWDFTYSYFVFSLVVVFVLWTYSSFFRRKFCLPKNWAYWLGFFLLCGAYIESRGSLFNEMFLWLDENSQIVHSTTPAQGRLAFGIAYDSQPPLSYPIYGALKELLGGTVFSVKLASLTFGWFYLILFYSAGYHITRSAFLSFLISLLVCLFPNFVFQSVEARVLNHFYFFCTLYLWSLYEFYRQEDFTNKIQLFCATYLMTLSLGLQPLVVLLWSGIITVLAFIFFSGVKSLRKFKKKLFYSEAVIVGGFLFSLPALWLSVTHSKDIDKFNSTYLDNFINAINFKDIHDFEYMFSHIWRMLGLMGLISLGALLVVVSVLNSYYSKNNRALNFLNPILFFAAVCSYSIVFFVLFKTIIKYQMMPRYYDAYFVILFFALLALIKLSLIHFNKSNIISKTLIGALLIGFYLPASNAFTDYRITFDNDYNYRIRWKFIYSFLEEKSKNNDDCFFMLPIVKADRWPPSFFVSTFAHVKPKDQTKYPRPEEHAYNGFLNAALAAAAYKNRVCSDIYFVISGEDFPKERKFDNFKLNGGITYNFIDPVIFKLNANNKDFYQRYKSFGLQIINHLGNDPRAGHFTMELALAAVGKEDKNTVRFLISQLRKIHPELFDLSETNSVKQVLNVIVKYAKN